MARRRPATPPKIPNATYLSFLGSGGFADVYLYEQQIPRREVAIKVLRRGVADAQRQSFRAEANLMARMSSHPSIVSVYGAGEAGDERMYLIMEYCPPPHLGARLRQQPFTVTHALEIGIQIGGAIETLHRAGIVHRDIKPSNILMTPFQRPVLTDFGIATRIGNVSPAEGFSVPWAPPEQATGEGAAAVTVDVYSLAATVYTLLAGRPPFEVKDGDNSEIAVINRVLRTPVPPMGRHDVPEEFERVLTIAMSKDPRQRYASVIDFARALQAIQAALHQRPTDLDVLDDPAYDNPSKSGDDADATRQAIRTIDPLRDDSTRLSPLRVLGPVPSPNIRAFPPASEARSYDAAGQRAPFDSALPGDAGGSLGGPAEAETGRRAPRSGEAPGWGPASSEGAVPDAPDARAGGFQESPLGVVVVRFLIAAAVVLAIVVGILFALRHGKGGTVGPATSTGETTPNDAGVNHVSQVVGLRGELMGDKVKFTWSNPDPKPGDKFLYAMDQISGEGQLNETKASSVTVPKQSLQTCLSVRVHRKGGSETPATRQCVSTP